MQKPVLTETSLLEMLPESSDQSITAAEIVKILTNSKWEQGLKSSVNKLLYALEKRGLVCRIDGTPPRWHKTSSPLNGNDEKEKQNMEKIGSQVRESRVLTFVYIDVDNSPCLKDAAPYAKGNTFIVAFASPAYNHFIPAEGTENITFKRISPIMDGKDVADVMFCMHMTETCLQKHPQDKITFLVVSKDKLLLTCGKMHANKYDVEFVPLMDGWTDLKMYLE